MTQKDKREIKRLTNQIRASRFHLRLMDDKILNKKLSAAEIDDLPFDMDTTNLYAALEKLDDAVSFLERINL